MFGILSQEKKKLFAELLLPLFTTNGKAGDELDIVFNQNSAIVRLSAGESELFGAVCKCVFSQETCY